MAYGLSAGNVSNGGERGGRVRATLQGHREARRAVRSSYLSPTVVLGEGAFS